MKATPIVATPNPLASMVADYGSSDEDSDEGPVAQTSKAEDGTLLPRLGGNCPTLIRMVLAPPELSSKTPSQRPLSTTSAQPDTTAATKQPNPKDIGGRRAPDRKQHRRSKAKPATLLEMVSAGDNDLLACCSRIHSCLRTKSAASAT